MKQEQAAESRGEVLLQTRALANLPASDASVIVATEPLWAAGFAALLLGEAPANLSELGLQNPQEAYFSSCTFC